MMGNYAAYTDYKDSEVEWLGAIPEHWEVDRIKWSINVCKNGIWGSEPDGMDDVCVLRVADFNRKFFTVDTINLTFRSVEKKELYGRLLKKGDLLLEKSGGGEKQLVGAVVQFDQDFIAVPSNFIARIEVNSLCDSRFVTYFHAHLYSGRVNYCSIKQTTGIQNLDSQHYLDQRMVFPPLDEQRAIAAFLDYKTQQIDQLIAKKESLLEKLDEKRTALISHAVTKGLDPTVPMKDSGIEWLGEIPAHWNLKKLKFVVSTIIDAEHKTATYDENGDYLVVRTTNVRSGKLLLEGAKFTNEATYREWTVRAIPEKGDILFTREAPAGEACLVPDKPTVCLGQRMVLFKFDKNKYNGYFLLKSLYSGIADEFIKSLSLGSTVAHFNMSDIACIPLLIPPFSEQKEIGEYLEKKINNFDDQIEKVKKGIDLLKEYRTALITNAVTGKIDVRSVPLPTP